MTNTMPLITRRSSTRALPRTSIGRSGCIEPHCSSLSQKRLDRIVSPRSESTSRANQQPIQTTTVLVGRDPSLYYGRATGRLTGQAAADLALDLRSSGVDI